MRGRTAPWVVGILALLCATCGQPRPPVTEPTVAVVFNATRYTLDVAFAHPQEGEQWVRQGDVYPVVSRLAPNGVIRATVPDRWRDAASHVRLAVKDPDRPWWFVLTRSIYLGPGQSTLLAVRHTPPDISRGGAP